MSLPITFVSQSVLSSSLLFILPDNAGHSVKFQQMTPAGIALEGTTKLEMTLTGFILLHPEPGVFLLIQPIGKWFPFSLREAPSPLVLVRLIFPGLHPKTPPGPELGVGPFLLHLRGPWAWSPSFILTAIHSVPTGFQCRKAFLKSS